MKRQLRLAAAAVVVAAGLSTAAEAAIKTDIVFVVDESGSMATVQANLRNNIGTFAQILSAGGIDASYALVGYGNRQVVPRLLTNFTTPGAFATAAQGLQINGGTEPAFSAITYALNGINGQETTLNFRADALKNIIILTDEPSNGDRCNASRPLCVGGGVGTGGVAANSANTDALLKSNQALLNAVLSGNSTINSIGPLATGNGGQVFNLRDFGSNNPTVVQNFVDTFANAKLQEILDTCATNPSLPGCTPDTPPDTPPGTPVPEPATLALLGAGLLGLGAVRRRRAAR